MRESSVGDPEESLALVLPTLREAANIEKVVRGVVAALGPLEIVYEVIVVDDASSDGTAAVVAALCKEFPQLQLIVRRGERGLAGAILDGWSQSHATILGVMDADLQHPPEMLRELWAGMGECGTDLVIASRYTHGAATGRWRRLRRAISEAALLASRPLQRSDRRVSDPMSGFFLVRRSILAELPSLQRTGFKLLLEILVRAPRLRVREIPFCFGVRGAGKSKAGFGVFGEYVRLLTALYGMRLRKGRRRTHAPAELPAVDQTRW